MTPAEFLSRAIMSATAAGHIFPEYAAAEAALESAWGESKLCRSANNLFGQKQGFTTGGCDSIKIPTREFLCNEWVTVDATWPKFDSWESSFRARMKLLQAKHCYSRALEAQTGEEFVKLVSEFWATDPKRAEKCLAIYRKHVCPTVSSAAIP